jgi:UDP-N-acetylmuramate dehydrogenase
LVSDNGFDGLVIKSSSDNVEVSGQEIRAESGLNLSRLVGLALQNSLVGLETLIGIPGTVGGAAFGNAGAYGVSFSKLIKEVEIYQAGVIKKLSAKEMNFDYRDSVLKYKPGIVLAVTVKLEPGDKKEIQAKAVKLAIERKQKLPTEPSAGCIFKNIKLDKVQLDVPRVIKELDITEAEWQKLTIHGKLSVAFVLDRLGLKGKIIGGCQISPKHANFFINLGNAKAEHVIMMISDVKMRVRNQLTVQLQEEIRYLGF